MKKKKNLLVVEFRRRLFRLKMFPETWPDMLPPDAAIEIVQQVVVRSIVWV